MLTGQMLQDWNQIQSYLLKKRLWQRPYQPAPVTCDPENRTGRGNVPTLSRVAYFEYGAMVSLWTTYTKSYHYAMASLSPEDGEALTRQLASLPNLYPRNDVQVGKAIEIIRQSMKGQQTMFSKPVWAMTKEEFEAARAWLDTEINRMGHEHLPADFDLSKMEQVVKKSEAAFEEAEENHRKAKERVALAKYMGSASLETHQVALDAAEQALQEAKERDKEAKAGLHEAKGLYRQAKKRSDDWLMSTFPQLENEWYEVEVLYQPSFGAPSLVRGYELKKLYRQPDFHARAVRMRAIVSTDGIPEENLKEYGLLPEPTAESETVAEPEAKTPETTPSVNWREPVWQYGNMVALDGNGYGVTLHMVVDDRSMRLYLDSGEALEFTRKLVDYCRQQMHEEIEE